MNELSTVRARRTTKEVSVLVDERATVQRALAMHEQASRSRNLFVRLWGVILAIGGMLFVVAEPLFLLDVLSRQTLRLSVLAIVIVGIVLLAALIQQYWLERERAADILRRSDLEAELKVMRSGKVR